MYSCCGEVVHHKLMTGQLILVRQLNNGGIILCGMVQMLSLHVVMRRVVKGATVVEVLRF